MRLVAFEQAGSARLGVVENNNVVDLSVAAPDLPRDLMGYIALGSRAATAVADAAQRAPASARRPLEGLKFLAPIARPPKIVCLGLNYVDHAAEGGHAKPEYPSFFLRVATSLVAHNAPILRPRVSDKLDYEAELAVIIGKTARHVKRADALSYVAGYSCFNDGTLRDYQRKTSQWTIGKNFDATGGFGPWFVTPEEVPAGAIGLAIRSKLNGQVMQNANTRDMIFPVDETIELLSDVLTLEPGDVIAMGTPSGVGYARKPPVWMKAGDVIEIEIEGVGTLRNPIVDEKA
jgi:acylpyruvate hydrolase